MKRARGFTLVEVLVALVVVALGLAALSTAVSGTARSSSILREKMQAQWIAMNRLTEVRLNLVKPGSSSSGTDAVEVKFGNRTWHYDTRYYDTNITTMKRVVVRVYAGEAKTKGNPLNETVGFVSTALATPPGRSNMLDWRNGQTSTAGQGTAAGTTPGTTSGEQTPPINTPTKNLVPGGTPTPTTDPNPGSSP